MFWDAAFSFPPYMDLAHDMPILCPEDCCQIDRRPACAIQVGQVEEIPAVPIVMFMLFHKFPSRIVYLTWLQLEICTAQISLCPPNMHVGGAVSSDHRQLEGWCLRALRNSLARLSTPLFNPAARRIFRFKAASVRIISVATLFFPVLGRRWVECTSPQQKERIPWKQHSVFYLEWKFWKYIPVIPPAASGH